MKELLIFTLMLTITVNLYRTYRDIEWYKEFKKEYWHWMYSYRLQQQREKLNNRLMRYGLYIGLALLLLIKF